MTKPPKNHRKPWTPQDDAELARLAAGNTPTRVIGIRLGRTEDAIYDRATTEGISLAPTNQHPYNRRKT